MTSPTATLVESLRAVLGERLTDPVVTGPEVTIVVPAADLIQAMTTLRDGAGLQFELLVDLCGVDYASYGVGYEGPRYAVVYHLLSLACNQRLRVRVFCEDDDMPRVASVIDVWPAANWFEREAFDLFGIVFEGHPDLRRILTDYGFIGHPFRKDFPLSGTVEMRYDADQRRVIYQPVTIEPRNNVPRIVREETYGDSE
ncbi:MAG: NADH-quinone oxidoreductase subunit C [Betaproteobacteria bacterium]|nr:NADH-quinone oxidoreductase subunit C [Betaproteobacteria bacterium]